MSLTVSLSEAVCVTNPHQFPSLFPDHLLPTRPHTRL